MSYQFPNPQAEIDLADQIRIKYGRFIDRAVLETKYPAGLLAALVANEAGLDENAQRFEPNDFWQLGFVAIGRKAAHDRAAFGAIGRQDLVDSIKLTGTGAIGQLVDLASSHGPLQIMGYEALAGKFALAELSDPNRCFVHGRNMLEAFRVRWDLVLPALDYAPWFACWNTGQPTGKTFDPDYAAKGCARLAIYEALPPAGGVAA